MLRTPYGTFLATPLAVGMVLLWDPKSRAVLEFGSGSGFGRNPAPTKILVFGFRRICEKVLWDLLSTSVDISEAQFKLIKSQKF